MGYNVLSGSVSSVGVIQSGSFSGDGSGLENVKQFELQNSSDNRIPFYKTIAGDLGLNASSTFTFNASTTTLTVPDLTASAGINLDNPVSGSLAGADSYLGLDANGNIVVTSSVAGEGPTNSLQFHTGNGKISGSAKLSYASNTLALSGAFAITGSILPSGSAVYNLGSLTQRWNEIFLGSGSLHLGDASTISTDDNIGAITFNKPLVVAGGIAATRQIVTASITASNASYFIGVSASSALTVQMPGAQTLSSGQILIIKDEGGNSNTNNITIKASGSQTIDGTTSVILESPYAAVNIYSNGVDKFFLY